MLVVSRKVGEKVVIPKHGIEITIVRILPNGQVRVGVSAPHSVGVFREELLSISKPRPEAQKHEQ